jgi:fucose permease
MAPLFPTTVALLVGDLGMVGLRTTGVFFSIAGLGGLFGPWLIGLISRELSLRFGFGVLPIFALVFLVLTIIYGLQKRRSLRV